MTGTDLLGLLSEALTTRFLLSVAVLVLCIAISRFYTHKIPSNAPPQVSDNLPIVGALGYWTQHWSWWRAKRDQSETGNFTFHAGANMIVAVAGDKGRRLFFESKSLGFDEGYAMLFGMSSNYSIDAASVQKTADFLSWFYRRLTFVLKKDQLRRHLPKLITDIREAFEAIKHEPSGRTDPFDSLYRLVFRLTIRSVGATEIAEDQKMLADAMRLYEMLEHSVTATSVIFPYFPSLAVIRRTYAGVRMCMMIVKIIKRRTADGKRHDDAVQHMIDQGDGHIRIVKFFFLALFAGTLNSGINAARVMGYLATSPEWLLKVKHEVSGAAAKYAKNPDASLLDQLDDIPIEAWESGFPVIGICLRESVRLNFMGAAMRRNISGKPIPTGHGDEVIPPGAFVTYANGDLHCDPEIYPEPHKWDPSRYLPKRAEGKKNLTHGFIGWGAGRHPCLGVHFARLEQNIITAYFVATFDFKLEDYDGNELAVAPPVNSNQYSPHNPKNSQFLRVTPKED